MLKGENLEDERSAQDYHIRRDEVLTLLLKEPDGNAAQTAQVHASEPDRPHPMPLCGSSCLAWVVCVSLSLDTRAPWSRSS